MIELLIGSVLVPILAKLGDKLIDRVAGELDERLVKLIKAAPSGSKERAALDSYLAKNTEAASQLASNVSEVLATPEGLAALSNLSGSKSRVEVCAEWLLNIGTMAFGLGRPVALGGFFSSKDFVTVFSNDYGSIAPEVAIERRGQPDAYISLPARFHVRLKWTAEEAERKATVAKLNRNFRISSAVPDDVRQWDQVEYVYEFWVQPASLSRVGADEFIQLPDDVRARWEISVEGTAALLNSVTEFMSEELKSLSAFLAAAKGRPA